MSTQSAQTFAKLELRPYQVDHFNRVVEILRRFFFYIDGSNMGCGKTIIVIAVALLFKLPVIVFCPLAAIHVWQTELAKYGVAVYALPGKGGIITYDSLRTRKGKQPVHELLIRHEGKDGVQYTTTPLFDEIVKKGVLLVFDECHKLKNTSQQHKAVKALISRFYELRPRSRIALLTGTAMTNKEEALNYLRMIGFITARNLYTKVRGQIRLDGVQELHRWCRLIDEKKTEEFVASHQIRATRQSSVEYVYDAFTQIIKPGVMSIMPEPKFDCIKDVKNKYYALDPIDEREYEDAVNALANAVRYNPKDESVVYNKDTMGQMNPCLIRVQYAKRSGPLRDAIRILTTIPNSKVIIFSGYYKVIDFMLEQFKGWNPVELTGRMKEQQRVTSVAMFQEPSLNTRLLIGNLRVGSHAINLHDTTGNFPRFMLIMPDYFVSDAHQATGRIVRDGAKGIATIRFAYASSGLGTRERSIIKAWTRSGEVLKAVHMEQSNNGVKFPNEYEDEYELRQ